MASELCKAFRDTVVPEKLPGWTETQDDDCLWVKVLLYMMVYPLGSTEAAGRRLFEQNIDEETRSVHQPVRNLACRILRKVLNRIELKNQSIKTEQFVIVASMIKTTIIPGPDNCRIGILHACSFAGDSVLLLKQNSLDRG